MQPEAEIGARSIACPACGGTVAIRAAGYTVTLACEYCGSLIDVADPAAKLIQRFEETQRTLAIPLGTRGTLRGVEWEAIGWVQRADSGVTWEEYLLFNPYHGYRWLVESKGHWSFGTMLTDNPVYENDKKFSYQGRVFSPFFRNGRATVQAVVGEFYWRVAQGETVRTADYVRPGAMLSMEENDQERSWTLNLLLDPDEIANAFPVPRPPKWHAGATPPPHMPSPFTQSLRTWWKITLAAAIMLLVMMVLSGRSGPAQSFSLAAVPDGPAVSRSFGPIILTAPRQGMTVRTSTPNVGQGWVDIDVAFVDRKTQASFEAYSVNEHYSGYDSDGSWSEGSTGQRVKLASLPAGTYDVMVDATAHSWTSGSPGLGEWNALSGTYVQPDLSPLTVSVTVAPGARFWSNFWIALLLLMLPLFHLLLRHLAFEKARIADSDGGGGGGGDDDDDDGDDE